MNQQSNSLFHGNHFEQQPFVISVIGRCIESSGAGFWQSQGYLIQSLNLLLLKSQWLAQRKALLYSTIHRDLWIGVFDSRE